MKTQAGVTVSVNTPAAVAKYYLVTRKREGENYSDHYTGADKFVQFWDGVGVLDLQAIAANRPDWVQNVAGELVQVTGETVENYRQYWLRRGFQVKEISAEEAAKVRAKASDAQKAVENAIARETKKSQGEAQHVKKFGPRRAEEDRLTEEARTAKAVANANAGVTPEDDDAPRETLPHEPGGAMAEGDEDEDEGDEPTKATKAKVTPATHGGGKKPS